jgi:hypothetical protein
MVLKGIHHLKKKSIANVYFVATLIPMNSILFTSKDSALSVDAVFLN